MGIPVSAFPRELVDRAHCLTDEGLQPTLVRDAWGRFHIIARDPRTLRADIGELFRGIASEHGYQCLNEYSIALHFPQSPFIITWPDLSGQDGRYAGAVTHDKTLFVCATTRRDLWHIFLHELCHVVHQCDHDDATIDDEKEAETFSARKYRAWPKPWTLNDWPNEGEE